MPPFFIPFNYCKERHCAGIICQFERATLSVVKGRELNNI